MCGNNQINIRLMCLHNRKRLASLTLHKGWLTGWYGRCAQTTNGDYWAHPHWRDSTREPKMSMNATVMSARRWCALTAWYGCKKKEQIAKNKERGQHQESYKLKHKPTWHMNKPMIAQLSQRTQVCMHVKMLWKEFCFFGTQWGLRFFFLAA